jgi:hypothetical protein
MMTSAANPSRVAPNWPASPHSTTTCPQQIRIFRIAEQLYNTEVSLRTKKMQRFDENSGRLEEVDEEAEEELDYDYEQVVENGEDAVGSRRRPKKPKELENCAEKNK